MEKQGGSKGYIKIFSSRKQPEHKATELLKFPYSVPFATTVSPGPTRDIVLVSRTGDGYMGTWTRGVWPRITLSVKGTLNFVGWDVLTSGTNIWTFVVGENLINITVGDETDVVAQSVVESPPAADILPGFAQGYRLVADLVWSGPDSASG